MTLIYLRSIAFFTFFLFFFQVGFSQKPPIKFGKVDISDLEMTDYEPDKGAGAVILCDFGTADLEYETTSSEFYVNITRHVRYKILNKSGIDYGNFEIPLYKGSNNETETLTKFKAATYNLKDGKIEDTPFSKGDLLEDSKSEYLDIVKAAMREVREGAVFEILYQVRSPFIWTLQDWQFQYTIPVKYSEYRVEYPEWFHYKKSFKGYDYAYLTTNDESSGSGRITFAGFARSGGYNQRSTATYDNVDYQTHKFRWVAEKMPAFEPEAYVSTHDNYLTAVKFELASTKFPNSVVENYTKTWEDINRELLENSSFGGQMGKMRVSFLKDKAANIAKMEGSTAEKAVTAFGFIRSKMTWNERQSVFSSENPKKCWEAGKGNSSDINLMLTSLLQLSGLDAHPVILSTRDNGFVNPYYPSLREFNYVISCVLLEDGKILLLDATNKSLAPHLLPARCINGIGILIREDSPQEIRLNPNGKFRKAAQVKLTLNEDGNWEGEMNVASRDYAARSVRGLYYSKGEEDYVKHLQNKNEGLEISESTFENLENITEETKEYYKVTVSDQVTDGGDLLYFNPMLMFGETENPFKLEERKYPVDFNYPTESIFSGQFEIPEGYVVEEVPERAIVSLPEKGGRFVYTINVQGNTINFTNQIQIKKHLFLPEEYGGLKTFYDIIVEKHGAQIVLKKKT